MAKPSQEISKTEFRANYNVVKILTSLTQAMEYIKTLKDNNNQAIAFGVRKTGIEQAPAWFRDFAEKVETFIAEQKKFNEDIVRLNNLKTK